MDVIANDKEYEVTKAKRVDVAKALQDLTGDDLATQLERASLEGLIADLDQRIATYAAGRWGWCGNKAPHQSHIHRWFISGSSKSEYVDYQCPGTPVVREVQWGTPNEVFEQCVKDLTDAIIELCYPEIVAKQLPPASRKVIENTARIHIKRAWDLGRGW
jgi:hypothetical protein